MEEKLSMMERKKERRLKRLQDRFKSQHKTADEDSDDDDESHNDGTPSQSNSDSSGGIQIVDPPPNYKLPVDTAAAAAAATQTRRTTRTQATVTATLTLTVTPKEVDLVELLDSSDDEQDYRPRGSQLPLGVLAIQGASKETMDLLQRSRMAQYRLQQAQCYHAEDVYVEVKSPPRPILAPASAVETTPKTKLPTRTANLGKNLRLKCRTQLERNGKKQPSPEDQQILTVREQEPLQVLLDKFLKAHSLLPSARVVMTFDGIILTMTRTPASYEMETDDLIDVSAKSFSMPLQVTTTRNNNKNNTGPKLQLMLRHKVGKQLQEHKLQLGQREVFSKLRDVYQTKHLKVPRGKTLSFHFDGEQLDWQKTPAAYDMESGDLIDVVITGGRR
jgi:hypothetical protein